MVADCTDDAFSIVRLQAFAVFSRSLVARLMRKKKQWKKKTMMNENGEQKSDQQREIHFLATTVSLILHWLDRFCLRFKETFCFLYTYKSSYQ